MSEFLPKGEVQRWVSIEAKLIKASDSYGTYLVDDACPDVHVQYNFRSTIQLEAEFAASPIYYMVPAQLNLSASEFTADAPARCSTPLDAICCIWRR